MFIMMWLLSSRLQEQQEDVFQNLEAFAFLPPSGEPEFSVFTIRNGGKVPIERHQIRCREHLIVGNHGTSTISGGGVTETPIYDTQLLPGGDSQTGVIGVNYFFRSTTTIFPDQRQLLPER